MINRRLTTELETNKKLDPRQHAFRPGKGVESHLAHLESLLSFENDEHVEIVALDISKAYDTTWKPGILRTLKEWKISGRMLNMLCSFLVDRSFQVSANGHISSSRIAENGVPQGSILSVTLFLIAMQPIFTKIPPNAEILLYADDVILVVKGSNRQLLRQIMNKTVRSVTEWANSVGFSIAPTKSKLLHCCRLRHRKRGRAIKINGASIAHVRKMRILGIMLDSNLNFKQHLASVKSSCSKRINILRILGCRLKRSSRFTLLKAGAALITSKLFFGLGLTSRNIDDMERILGPTYNEVVRQSSGAFVSSPINSVMAEAGCLPFRLALIQRLAQLAVRLLEKNPSAVNYPVVLRAKDFLRQTTGYSMPNVCSTLRNYDREWYAHSPYTENHVRNKIKAGTNSNIVIPTFQELISNQYQYHKKTFTDGSKDADFTGVGVVMEDKEESYALPEACSVFSAEAHALMTAATIASEHHNTIIFTDSASCLDALQSGHSKHPWIQSIERVSRSRSITFCWIPGHCGIAGNERADSLAKQARSKQKLDIALPAQDLIKNIRRKIWSVWELEWRQSVSQLRQVKCSPIKYPDRKCASEQRTLTRLRIGHTRLTHSYLFNKSSPPMCNSCGTRTTVQHILTDCRLYAHQRSNCGITGSLCEILSYNPQRETAILQFLKDSNIYNEI